MFIVVQCAATPEHLNGYISRFLLEADVGLYVGVCSHRVADKLWEHICEAIDTWNQGRAVLIYSSNTEQGYEMRTHGEMSREVIDLDGLLLLQEQRSYAKSYRFTWLDRSPEE